MRLIKLFISFITIIVVAGFLLSGFSVGIDPRVSVYLSMLSMTFPFWIAAMIVITIAVAVLRAKTSMIIVLIAWIVGGYNVMSISPWNVSRQPEADEPTLSVMTYNVYYFNLDGNDTISQDNPTVNSIINCNADIVALQESASLEKPIPARRITRAQCEKIKEVYPYADYGPGGMSLLSKYPFETIEVPEQPSGTARFAAYRVKIPYMPEIGLLNVHLQSFRLNTNERQVYVEITDGEMSKEILSEARNEILPKVKGALVSHATEGEMLVRDIDNLFPNGPMILCGDFNDISGSFPLKLLYKDCHLDDAFRKGAFGPTYTYHNSRFYFNIDHILYRDFPRPLYTQRLKVAASDHYPLFTVFSLKDFEGNKKDQ